MKKQEEHNPRKPTYILVQKPTDINEMPKVYAKCGGDKHDPKLSSDRII